MELSLQFLHDARGIDVGIIYQKKIYGYRLIQKRITHFNDDGKRTYKEIF